MLLVAETLFLSAEENEWVGDPILLSPKKHGWVIKSQGFPEVRLLLAVAISELRLL